MLPIIHTAGPLVAAGFFFASAFFWFRGAAFKLPDIIDLGTFKEDAEQPKDWFWAYGEAAKRARWAAGCAGAGALITGIVELSEKFLT